MLLLFNNINYENKSQNILKKCLKNILLQVTDQWGHIEKDISTLKSKILLLFYHWLLYDNCLYFIYDEKDMA